MNIEEINAALLKLDHANDSDWTEEGLPNPDIVFGLLGNPESIEKAQTAAYIQWAAPEFRRVKPDSVSIAPVVVESENELDSELDILPEIVATSDSKDAMVLAAEEFAKAEKVFNEAQAALRKAQENQDRLAIEQEKVSKGNPIGEYLERQKLNMAAKAEKMQMLRENSELLRDILQVKSPLDSALANRKRNR